MDDSLTIDEFCAKEKISRSYFYKMKRANVAPATYPIGRTWRISSASREAWRSARETARVAA